MRPGGDDRRNGCESTFHIVEQSFLFAKLKEIMCQVVFPFPGRRSAGNGKIKEEALDFVIK